jgi:CO/xanthine dehydrogenase Mo-binding subunit
MFVRLERFWNRSNRPSFLAKGAVPWYIERMAKTYFSRATILNGIVIRSTVDSGIIDTINLPQLGSRFLTIEAKDVRGENRLKVASDYMPLLSSNQISYKGQPIMALFGFDSESVQLKAKEIDISYRLTEAGQAHQESAPYIRQAGDMDAVTKAPDLKYVTRTYDYTRLSSPSYYITRIMAGMDGGTLHIVAPTQWMFHMRDTVSDITLIPKKKIVIHRTPFYAPHDEMLITPSVLAAIAALACMKGNYPVEIQDSYPVYRPAMHVERTTWFMGDGKPVADDIKATVDQGAIPLFSEEMSNQMFAGFAPPCPLDAYRCAIQFSSSDLSPAHFYGDLGYGEALATTESQYHMVAQQALQNPWAWKSQFYGASDTHDALIHCARYPEMKTLVNDLVARSDFNRKYATFQVLRDENEKFSPFISYARGIGFALGPGIAGFSSDCKNITPLSVQLQLDPGDKVKVNTCFYTNGASARIWKKVISEQLGIQEANIQFPADTDEMVDSGPSVLASNSGRMPSQIQRVCELVKQKRFVNPLPLVESVNGFPKSDSLFSSSSWVGMVLELSVDTIAFQPLVRRIWVSVLTGRIFDEQAYREKIRHTIVTTLLENGAVLATGKNLTIDLTLKSDGEDVGSSVTSAVRSMTLATFSMALDQALGGVQVTLPMKSEIILNTIMRKRI